MALYGASGKRWTLTERGHAEQSPASLVIGPSSVTWDGDAFTIQIDEMTTPLPSRLRGQVRVYPQSLTDQSFVLDAAGQHRWWPIAPCARIEVALECPALRWRGTAYLDTNAGDGPLEQAFTSWDWSRASMREGASILYDVRRSDGSARSIAIWCDSSGGVEPFEPPPAARLPTTRWWRITRATRGEAGEACVSRTLEDTPFYARSVVSTRLLGEPVTAMHESLSLERFRQAWVRLLLRFRMPRAAR